MYPSWPTASLLVVCASYPPYHTQPVVARLSPPPMSSLDTSPDSPTLAGTSLQVTSLPTGPARIDLVAVSTTHDPNGPISVGILFSGGGDIAGVRCR